MDSRERPFSSQRQRALRVGLAGLLGFLAACQKEASETNLPGVSPIPHPNVETTDIPFPTATPETPTLEPYPTPEPSPTPDLRTSLEKYLYPALSEVTNTRRAEKAQQDSEYSARVDQELNENRVNFVLLGRKGDLTDSIQFLTLDFGKNAFNTISIHRDTVAPEISRFTDVDVTYRINAAFTQGGIPLVEKIMEDATSLSADFLIVSETRVLQRAVERLFDNQLEVYIPWSISDPAGNFPQGRQVLSGDRVLAAAKARYYASNRERNIVQQHILEAVISRAKQELSENPISAVEFIVKSLAFLEDEISSGAIKTNFDSSHFFELGNELIKVISTEGITAEVAEFGFPAHAGGYHIDAESAGGSRLKPISGDPGADDLLKDYWFSSRKETKDFLLFEQ